MHFKVNLDELDKMSRQFWSFVQGSRIFAFHGEMGAGKTTIITALCRYKGVRMTMGSPTYSIINEYVFQDQEGDRIIYHIDLYRLKDETDVIRAGVEDCINNSDFCMVEWPEKALGLFEAETVHVYIKVVSETERSIQVKLPSTL